jgi:hypothetical protein
MATSPGKSQTSRKSIASGSVKPRKSVKSATRGRDNDETVYESTQETEKQTKAKKSTGRKSIKAMDPREKTIQGAASLRLSGHVHLLIPSMQLNGARRNLRRGL